MALITKNPKRIERHFQHKKCSLASLVMIWKISEFMDKDKGGFMLDKNRLARVHREEHDRKYLHFIYHMHIEKVHQEYSQINCIALYRTWRDDS